MAMINQRDREACGAEWLNQPIESYHVDIVLSDGDEINVNQPTSSHHSSPKPSAPTLQRGKTENCYHSHLIRTL